MASDTITASDTPQGTDVETAASSIAELLARDSGEPGAAAPRMPQTKADAAEAQHPGSDGGTPIDAEGPDAEPEVEIEPEDPPAEVDDDAAEPDPAKTLVTVEIDGKAQRLPLAEVTRGYLRQADYTRKTQTLAEDRREFEGEASAVRQERLQYAQLLPALAFQIQQMQGPEPDWARLKEEDPVGYMLKREEWREGQSRMEAARQEYERVRMAEAIATEGEVHAKLREESERLVQAMPAWRDKERRNADRIKVREYGRGLGWSEEELSSVTDHRAVVVLYKAMKYDEAMQRRLIPEPPRPRSPSPRPGAPLPPRQTTDLARAKQRLAKSNSLRDAQAVIEKLL